MAMYPTPAVSGVPDKDTHYNRNDYNNFLPQTAQEADALEWDGTVSANAHQFSAPNRDNVKFVSPDGTREAIYNANGQLVLDPRDVGTYNFSPSNTGIAGFIGHAFQDVIPWIIWGNSPEDTTTWWDRTKALVGWY